VIYLAELALELAGRVLTSNGVFIAKLFQGQGFDPFVLDVRKMFNGVSIIKPEASRSRSREVYLVAKGLKAN
jgi:23S rRNA (uridine2552-2'-O)-methyltransferase